MRVQGDRPVRQLACPSPSTWDMAPATRLPRRLRAGTRAQGGRPQPTPLGDAPLRPFLGLQVGTPEEKSSWAVQETGRNLGGTPGAHPSGTGRGAVTGSILGSPRSGSACRPMLTVVQPLLSWKGSGVPGKCCHLTQHNGGAMRSEF